MIITESEKRNVMALLEGSQNSDDKKFANELLSAMTRGMDGDQSAEADIRALMEKMVVNSMLYTACERMIAD